MNHPKHDWNNNKAISNVLKLHIAYYFDDLRPWFQFDGR
jgi:hypothetical protein